MATCCVRSVCSTRSTPAWRPDANGPGTDHCGTPRGLRRWSATADPSSAGARVPLGTGYCARARLRRPSRRSLVLCGHRSLEGYCARARLRRPSRRSLVPPRAPLAGRLLRSGPPAAALTPLACASAGTARWKVIALAPAAGGTHAARLCLCGHRSLEGCWARITALLSRAAAGDRRALGLFPRSRVLR